MSVVGLVLVLFIAAFTLLLLEDAAWRHAERLPRNITFYGEDLSGASFEQAKRTIMRLVADAGDDVVTVGADGTAFDFFRRDLGYPLDGTMLLLKAKSLGREGNIVTRLAFRLSSLWRQRSLAQYIAVDEVKLGRLLLDVGDDLGTTAKDAAFAIADDGSVTIIPSEKGSLLNEKASADRIRRHLADVKVRRFSLVIDVDADPKVTTADLEALHIDGLLATFTTYYSEGAANRAHNIALAASLLDMTVIAAGEEFSFNGIVGERSRERGFLDAAIIENGVLSDGLGGGVCQVSTTVYGAALRSGCDIVERRPHSLVSAYVEPGQDAMVSWGTSDLRLLNTYGCGLLLHATAADGAITVSLYGDSRESHPVDVVSEIVATIPFETEVVVDKSLGKGAQYTRAAGKPGLECTVYRVFEENGEKKRETVSNDTYLAQKRVVVTGP